MAQTGDDKVAIVQQPAFVQTSPFPLCVTKEMGDVCTHVRLLRGVTREEKPCKIVICIFQSRDSVCFQMAHGKQVGEPVVQQPVAPGQVVWMSVPQAPLGCPAGLEYLCAVDQVLIQQQIELLEAFTGCETRNKYRICNTMNQQVYFAIEETDCCTRQCCGPGRPFEMAIVDNMQREVIHLSRPLRCQCCCCPCCLQEIEIQSPPGTVIGYVEQQWTLWKAKLHILNAEREHVLTVKGPCCPCSCGGDVEFMVLSVDETSKVGTISKQWSGIVREMFTDADNFGVTFPLDLDVKVKAILLGATFLIDFMFFEHNK